MMFLLGVVVGAGAVLLAVGVSLRRLGGELVGEDDDQ